MMCNNTNSDRFISNLYNKFNVAVEQIGQRNEIQKNIFRRLQENFPDDFLDEMAKQNGGKSTSHK